MNLHHQLPKPDLKRLSYLDFGIKSQIPRGRGQPEIPNKAWLPGCRCVAGELALFISAASGSPLLMVLLVLVAPIAVLFWSSGIIGLRSAGKT